MKHCKLFDFHHDYSLIWRLLIKKNLRMFFGEFLGNFWEIFGKFLGNFWEDTIMRKKTYKGRCEKRKLEKFEGICKTYDPVQYA